MRTRKVIVVLELAFVIFVPPLAAYLYDPSGPPRRYLPHVIVAYGIMAVVTFVLVHGAIVVWSLLRVSRRKWPGP